jgi:hypothetical protein
MTIAQQLNVKDFPFEIKDKNGKYLYCEDSTGVWEKYEYDTNGNRTRFENSNGYWINYEYDAKGNQIRYETSEGYWFKQEYNADGYQIYAEDHHGVIVDNRPKPVELTLDEIATKFGIDVNQLKIKK